jgi:CheY-like chemotaxis protein
MGFSHFPIEWLRSEAAMLESGSIRTITEDSLVDPTLAQKLNEAAAVQRDPTKATVLYVDDTSDLIIYVRDLLAPVYNLFVANDGRDGLAKAREVMPDVIVSDLMMPVMDGLAFCRAVRNDPELAAIPFVLLTARSGPDEALEGLKAGANDYLTKPIREAEVLARLRNLVSLRRGQVLLKRELQAARAIQRSLLPPSPQAIAGGQLECLYHPCEELSGDFFDAILGPRFTFFYLLDVTSHGTAAAQITYVLRGLFREAIAGAAPDVSLERIVNTVADRYAEYKTGYSAALQFCRFDAEKSVLDCTRGHAAPPILVRGGKSELLKIRPGMGLSSTRAHGRVHVESIPVSPGDIVYLFTDGAHEFQSGGRQYGIRRLADLLGQQRDDWSENTLQELAVAHGGRRFGDDLTMVRLVVAG